MGILVPKIKEKRRSDRVILTGLMPGKMHIGSKTGKLFSARPIDVSPQGLGIITTEVFKDGTRVFLEIDSYMIEMETVWKKVEFSKHSEYRYGLRMLKPGLNLEELFKNKGCFREENDEGAPVIQASLPQLKPEYELYGKKRAPRKPNPQ